MNLASTLEILAGGPGSGRHKELFNKMQKNPKGKTDVRNFFKIENTALSKKLDNSRWGRDGYDESVVGKKGILNRKDLENNIWVNDHKFQPTVTNSGVTHYVEKGTNEKLDPSGFKSGNPIRLVEYDGKYYIHDGRHRLAAAIIRGDDKVPVHIWKLKNSDFRN
jgi:hypothetical protein